MVIGVLPFMHLRISVSMKVVIIMICMKVLRNDLNVFVWVLRLDIDVFVQNPVYQSWFYSELNS